MLSATEAKRKVEELMGRRDALKGEIARAETEQRKFADQNLTVEAREAGQDAQRLRLRLQTIDAELNQLRKFW